MRHRVGVRLGSSYAVVILLLGVSWLVAAVAMSKLQASYRDTVVRTDGLVREVYIINGAMLDQETGWRAYLIADNRGFLKPYYAGQGALPAASARAQQLVADPEERQLLRVVLQRAHTWQQWVGTELRLWDAGERARVRSEVSVGTGKQLFDRFSAATNDMLRHLRADKQNGLDSSRGIFNQANLILGAIMLSAIALVVLLGWQLTRSIVQPLRQLRGAATRIRRGHFDVPVPHEGHDEIAQLAADMDTMRDHLDARRRVADLLASTLALDAIYPAFAAEVKRLVPFDRLSVSIIESDGAATVTAYAEGAASDQFMAGDRRPIDDTVFSRAVSTGEPVLIDDTVELQLDQVDWVALGIRSVVMVPLRTKGRVVGTLNLSSSTSHAYDEGTVATLATLTQPLANAVENAHLYQEISETNVELERASRLKSEFLANMSHELRTPLNAIIGFSEVLQDATFGSLNNRQQRYVGNVLESGRHLLELVNDILDISKVEAGHMELRQEDLDVRALLAEVGDRMLPLARNKQIALQIEANGDAPLIHADRARFMQIMLNLLSNAIKFTPSGGTVGVTYRVEPEVVAIAVKDTGIGIAEHDQARIFEEFEQVDSSVGRTQQGTGLGLALTKRLVELHGGTIGVHSLPGQGSTFTVSVPRAQQVAPLRGIRGDVLVVEDDPAARELLSVYLTEAGYGVQWVDRVADVLPRALEAEPVAITLDLALKNEMGWSALEQLKAHPETRDIPVVIISILDEEQMGFALGASAYLTKPVARQDLLDVLERLAGKRSKAPDQLIRVLAVDDQPEALELIALALEGSRYQLIRATNGTDALELLTRERPDVLIVDLMMAPVSGFDVIDAAAADSQMRHIPIVVWTARDLTAEDTARLNGHVTARLSKRDFAGAGKERFLWELERVTGETPGDGSTDVAH